MTTLHARPAVLACWLWPVALVLAAGQTWVDFAAQPGLNWLLSTVWTVMAFIALHRFAGKPLPWRVLLTASLACLLAGGAAVTANPFLDLLILLTVLTLLATSLLIAGSPGIATQLGLIRLAMSPAAAAWSLLLEAGRRLRDAAGYARAEKSLPTLRGIALALPITLAFALLLSNAEPVLAGWRQVVLIALRDLGFLNRGLVFAIFATVALGSLGIALAAPAGRDRTPGPPSQRSVYLGVTERVIVLGAVVGLFALFFGLQLSHFLGQEAATPGSGVTYAQAAHEGFGELTIAATLCATLLIALSRSTGFERFHATERRLSLALILLAQLTLLSAFHRITVYEQAYGYTELRLFVQAYAVGVLICLALLWLEIGRRPDFTRLVQRCALTAALALCALVYWNHAAWIARQNILRYERTGTLDLSYLVRGLGPDAVPELTASLTRLPPPLQTGLRDCLRTTYATHPAADGRGHAWYEWSYRRAALRSALRAEGLQATALSAAAPPRGGCQ